MSSTERRERERAQRHQLIITAARELAEAEGWDAVTTRRLAERVEYSQPVLYSHFKGKDAIVRAVALEGFEGLTAQMRRARLAEISPKEALRALGRAYLDFAANRPALYEAMFIMPTDLAFASTETPPALRAAFDEIVAVVGPRDGVGLYAEVFWGSLHGIAVLVHGKRMPAEHQGDRLDLLVEHFAPEAG
ncbi:TetR/AcrR family transcriptional regulator [Streptomyces milbemycinicus]|uniref:TetR/AcrR family transcriptional regulator n=1 Tax=Streptomyces milbemycinicus TaxID=476552 RepID=UPI003407E55E